MDELKLMAEKIVKACKITLTDKNFQTPNYKIVKVILSEFQVILQYMERQNKVLLLNKKKELWSIKIIIDSADYSYDADLFDMVRSFHKLSRSMDENYILYQFY